MQPENIKDMAKDKSNKGFWQTYAKLYGPMMNFTGKGVYKALCEDIAKDWRGDEKVLELACGSGQLSFLLADKCASYMATDFSENMIREAKKKDDGSVKGLSFEVQDATDIKYEDESFDVVVIANALHIMPDPDSAMEEIRRILKPGGILYAPTFTQKEGKEFKPWIQLISRLGFKTYNKWSHDDLVAFVEKHGFMVESSDLIDGGVSPLAKIKALK